MAGIADEPAFCWWVPYTIEKRNKIIASVHSRLAKKVYKYCIQVLGSVYEAYEIDCAINNHFWRMSIAKGMKNNRIAFEVLPKGSKPPPGYKSWIATWCLI